jgi:lysophospholipase L1-like esterase
MLSRWKHVAFASLTLVTAVVIAIGVIEATLQVAARFGIQERHDGAGGIQVPHSRWGWRPTPGWFREQTREFTVEGQINDRYMNDRPVHAADATKTRIFVLGDSHTYAVGVSQHETWVRVLEDRLNGEDAAYRTYNAAAPGYSMHQYVTRLEDQGPALAPHVVIVAVSFATDFFDLLPPDRGGWIYGGDRERDYFDISPDGELESRHWRYAEDRAPRTETHEFRPWRERLMPLRIYQLIRRSPLAMLVASRVGVEGSRLWPNMDVVMERAISPKHEYQHRLFKLLLRRLADRSHEMGARLLVVGIPYLPQIYPEVAWLFSGDRYDTRAMSRRMSAYCAEAGADYIDTLEPLIAAATRRGSWLHHRYDGHPTVDGHRVIAESILQSGYVQQARSGALKPHE